MVTFSNPKSKFSAINFPGTFFAEISKIRFSTRGAGAGRFKHLRASIDEMNRQSPASSPETLKRLDHGYATCST